MRVYYIKLQYLYQQLLLDLSRNFYSAVPAIFRTATEKKDVQLRTATATIQVYKI